MCNEENINISNSRNTKRHIDYFHCDYWVKSRLWKAREFNWHTKLIENSNISSELTKYLLLDFSSFYFLFFLRIK